MRYAYNFAPVDICNALRKLFGLGNAHLSNAKIVSHVIDWHEQGLDFSDAFHLALSHQHGKLKSFDQKFIK